MMHSTSIRPDRMPAENVPLRHEESEEAVADQRFQMEFDAILAESDRRVAEATTSVVRGFTRVWGFRPSR